MNSLARFLNKIKKDYLFYFSKLTNRALVAPDMLQIMITTKCNLKCQICDVWSQKFNNELTTAEVKNLIDQALKMGIETIYFTGGEALLRPDIFELINYASRPQSTTTLNTNGSLVTKDMAQKIFSSNLDSISFSIDSVSPQIHNAIRGEQVFEKAIKGIKYLQNLKKENGQRKNSRKQKLDINIASVIIKPNKKELFSLAMLARDLECNTISFQPIVYNGNLLKSADLISEYSIDSEDIADLKESFNQLQKISDKDFIVFLMPEKTIQYFQKQKRVNTCFAGFNRIFINPQGDISFVCFESFGNIKKDLLKKAWQSKKANTLRGKTKKCTVNCTQFCSERPTSETLRAIHLNLAHKIKNQSRLFKRIKNKLKKTS